MKTCWIAAALLSLAAACGVGTQACSSLPGAKSGPTAAPGAAPPVAPGPAPGLLTPAAEVTLAHSADLSGFVPLLSLPELSVAAQAYGVEDYATCAALVDTYVRGNQFSVLEEPRWYLLLGSLREKAGDLLGASQAYERAAQSAWPLADYAALANHLDLTRIANLEQDAQIEPEDRHDRRDRRADAVAENDAPLAQPLGARGADVVLGHRVDQVAAQEPRVDRRERRGQYEPRQYQRTEPLRGVLR